MLPAAIRAVVRRSISLQTGLGHCLHREGSVCRSGELASLAPLRVKGHMSMHHQLADTWDGRLVRAVNWSLPVSTKVRAALSLFVLIVAIAWFWQPLVALYSLSQAERHYSHFVLIPFVSVFSFYLNRNSFLAFKEWSPLPGVILLALGAFGYSQTDSLAKGFSDLPLAIIAFVLTCWGIFLFFYGIRSFRVVFIWSVVSSLYGSLSRRRTPRDHCVSAAECG